MSKLRLSLVLLCACCTQAADPDDVILRAMRAELARSRDLKFANLESPYYVEVNIDDVSGFSAVATLGGLLSASQVHHRSPRVEVRVEARGTGPEIERDQFTHGRQIVQRLVHGP